MLDFPSWSCVSALIQLHFRACELFSSGRLHVINFTDHFPFSYHSQLPPFGYVLSKKKNVDRQPKNLFFEDFGPGNVGAFKLIRKLLSV